MGIGENIKNCRKALHMTLEEVSAKVGVSRQTLCRYESGKISNIPPENIEALAEALETTPAALMGWTDALAASIADDRKSGRAAAKEEMFRTFGAEHSAASLRAQGDKTAVLYYRAFARNIAPEVLTLLESVEGLDLKGITDINKVVQGYLHAKGHIREIVDVTLRPSLKGTAYGKYQEDTGEDGDQL